MISECDSIPSISGNGGQFGEFEEEEGTGSGRFEDS